MDSLTLSLVYRNAEPTTIFAVSTLRLEELLEFLIELSDNEKEQSIKAVIGSLSENTQDKQIFKRKISIGVRSLTNLFRMNYLSSNALLAVLVTLYERNVLNDKSCSIVVGGMAGITAKVSATHKKSFMRVGILRAPKPIIVITKADTLVNGKIKSARYWLTTDSVNSIS